jgi:hypothetical protein
MEHFSSWERAKRSGSQEIKKLPQSQKLTAPPLTGT